MAAGTAVDGHPHDLLLGVEVECAGSPRASTNLKRESWKYPTYGSHALRLAAVVGALVSGVVIDAAIEPSDWGTL